MSDLVGNHIVGIPTRRLNCTLQKQIFTSPNYPGLVQECHVAIRLNPLEMLPTDLHANEQ